MVTWTTILRLGRSCGQPSFRDRPRRRRAAQSFTIGGASAQTSQPGADFATTILGDPWDFTERTDWVHMYSDNESGASAWSGTPTQTGGVFRGVSSGQAPSVQVLYQGIDGALNAIGKNGVITPIDASRYRRLSFRARRSVGTPDIQDRIAAFWFPQPVAGRRRLRAVAGPRHAARLAARQHDAAGRAERRDLPDLSRRSRRAAAGRGSRVGRPGQGPQDSPRLVGHACRTPTFDLDWMRLTERGNGAAIRRLQWSGFGGRVVLRATHAQSGDVIQIYPEGHHPGRRLRRQQPARLGLRLPAAGHVDDHGDERRRRAHGDAEHRSRRRSSACSIPTSRAAATSRRP